MQRSIKTPIQETGVSNLVKKVFCKGNSGGFTVEELIATKWQKIVDCEPEPSVEHIDRLPDDQAPSSGIKDSNLSITKVSVETQTETELPEQSPDVNLDLEMEKERGIKEMSTQTLPEENDQPAPGHDVKVKKKKQRPRRRRSSKERRKGEEAELILSSDDPKSGSNLLQLPVRSGNIMRLVIPAILFWFFFSFGMAQCTPVLDVNEQWHAYSFVTNHSLTGVSLTFKRGIQDLCEIIFKMEEETSRDCNGSPVYRINASMLLLVMKEKQNNSLFLEAGDMNTIMSHYEGAFNDPESAFQHFSPDRLLATTAGHQHTDKDTFPWWGIVLIFLAIGIGIAAVLYVIIKRPCKMKAQPTQGSTEPTELEDLQNPLTRNGGPECAATPTVSTPLNQSRGELMNGTCVEQFQPLDQIPTQRNEASVI